MLPYSVRSHRGVRETNEDPFIPRSKVRLYSRWQTEWVVMLPVVAVRWRLKSSVSR